MKIILRKDNILLLLYVTLASLYTLPVSNVKVFNLFATMLFYFNIVFILLGVLYVFQRRDWNSFFILVCTSVLAFVICIINGTSMHNLCVFITLIVGMYYTTYISYSNDYYKILCVVGLFYNMFSLLFCQNYCERWSIDEVSLMNPNTIGIMNLFYAIIVNSYIYLRFESQTQRSFWGRNKKKIVYVAYNSLILYILFSYKGRTSQFSMLIFLFLFYILSEKIVKKTMILISGIGLLILAGVLFPILYVNMPKIIMDWIAEITGKSYFSGREVIWSRFFIAMDNKRNLLIGPGDWRKAEYTKLGTRVFSMHNNYLDIMLCFGVIGIAMFLIAALFRIYQLSKKEEITNYVCLLGYIAFVVLGYSENTFVYPFLVMFFNVLIGMSLFKPLNK